MINEQWLKLCRIIFNLLVGRDSPLHILNLIDLILDHFKFPAVMLEGNLDDFLFGQLQSQHLRQSFWH